MGTVTEYSATLLITRRSAGEPEDEHYYIWKFPSRHVDVTSRHINRETFSISKNKNEVLKCHTGDKVEQINFIYLCFFYLSFTSEVISVGNDFQGTFVSN